MPSLASIMFWLKRVWGGVVVTEFSNIIVSVSLHDTSPINLSLFDTNINVLLMPNPPVELLIYKNELNVDLMRNEPINMVINE